MRQRKYHFTSCQQNPTPSLTLILLHLTFTFLLHFIHFSLSISFILSSHSTFLFPSPHRPLAITSQPVEAPRLINIKLNSTWLPHWCWQGNEPPVMAQGSPAIFPTPCILLWYLLASPYTSLLPFLPNTVQYLPFLHLLSQPSLVHTAPPFHSGQRSYLPSL